VYCIVVHIVVKLLLCLINISARHMDDWKLTTSPVVRLKRSVLDLDLDSNCQSPVLRSVFSSV